MGWFILGNSLSNLILYNWLNKYYFNSLLQMENPRDVTKVIKTDNLFYEEFEPLYLAQPCRESLLGDTQLFWSFLWIGGSGKLRYHSNLARKKISHLPRRRKSYFRTKNLSLRSILESGCCVFGKQEVHTSSAMATPVVVLDRGNNTTCTINLHGCTIVSWRVNNQVKTRLNRPYPSSFGLEIGDPLKPNNMTLQLIVTKNH